MNAQDLQRIVQEKLSVGLDTLRVGYNFPKDDVQVHTIFRKNNHSLSLLWSKGIGYHTDDLGYDYTTILTLHNPGYSLKVREGRKLVVLRSPEFFSFKLSNMHSLFWDSAPKRRERRENWIGLCVDSVKSPVDFSEFSEIVLKSLGGRTCQIINNL